MVGAGGTPTPKSVKGLQNVIMEKARLDATLNPVGYREGGINEMFLELWSESEVESPLLMETSSLYTYL